MNSPSLKQIVLGDLSFAVQDEGDGPAVLLIHGFPDSHLLWRNQVPALVAAGYRVIAPDLLHCAFEKDLHFSLPSEIGVPIDSGF